MITEATDPNATGPTQRSNVPRSGSDPRFDLFAFTPRRGRYAAAGCLILALGIAVNVLLLQRAPAVVQELQGPDGRSVVTGVDRAERSVASAAIKTSGLPRQTTEQIDADIKRWQAKLGQLRDDVPSAETGSAPAGAVGPDALEPQVAHRVDDGAVAPVTQQTVRAIQRELTARGYDPGSIDGNIGVLTQAAIMAYEHDEKIAVTGEPSEALLRRMVLGDSGDTGDAAASPQRVSESAERLVRGVQKALAGLRYAPGEANGRLTEDTQRAIREFEMDQGLVPSGRISGRLILRLARASGRAFVVPVR